MPAEDKEMTRMVQREISRRYVDSSQVDVKAIHGVVYLRGVVRPLRNVAVDLQQEIEIIQRILRNKPGIRDVINEMQVRG
ncbi:MAG: BON domain-containing protein [Armatimonadetes bacterium]|nr:BON domain-containing protein [Armatimonadota bacterium]